MTRRQLLVLRHGSAVGIGAGSDRDRELTPEGATEMARLGTRLRTRGLVPDIAVASPARRTRVTAEAVITSAELPSSILSFDERAYEATRGALLAVIGDIDPNASRVLLVCHNPGAERLIEHLSGERIGMRSGMMTVLDMPGVWSGLDYEVARVEAILRPEELD